MGLSDYNISWYIYIYIYIYILCIIYNLDKTQAQKKNINNGSLLTKSKLIV